MVWHYLLRVLLAVQVGHDGIFFAGSSSWTWRKRMCKLELSSAGIILIVWQYFIKNGSFTYKHS